MLDGDKPAVNIYTCLYNEDIKPYFLNNDNEIRFRYLSLCNMVKHYP